MQDVASRIRGRVQLTTDGHRAYLNAVEDAFGADVDYAVLQKIYCVSAENHTALHSLQLSPHPQDASHHPGNGRLHLRPRSVV